MPEIETEKTAEEFQRCGEVYADHARIDLIQAHYAFGPVARKRFLNNAIAGQRASEGFYAAARQLMGIE
jgi:hypothetical protein